MAKLVLTALKQVIVPTELRVFVKVVPGDNVYVAGGVQLDITPGKILDPNSLGLIGPTTVPAVPPGVYQESMSGYYAQVIPTTGVGVAGLSGYKLQYFQPGGAEIAAGAYPGAITNGSLILVIE